MKLVAFCAVGFACVSPMLAIPHGKDPASYAVLAAFEGVAVPLVWTGLSMVLVRRGPWRDRLVMSLLLCSVSIALVFGCLMLFLVIISNYGNPARSPASRIRPIAVAEHVLAIVALAGAVLFLASRLFERRTPRTVDSADMAKPAFGPIGLDEVK